MAGPPGNSMQRPPGHPLGCVGKEHRSLSLLLRSLQGSRGGGSAEVEKGLATQRDGSLDPRESSLSLSKSSIEDGAAHSIPEPLLDPKT